MEFLDEFDLWKERKTDCWVLIVNMIKNSGDESFIKQF